MLSPLPLLTLISVSPSRRAPLLIQVQRMASAENGKFREWGEGTSHLAITVAQRHLPMVDPVVVRAPLGRKNSLPTEERTLSPPQRGGGRGGEKPLARSSSVHSSFATLPSAVVGCIFWARLRPTQCCHPGNYCRDPLRGGFRWCLTGFAAAHSNCAAGMFGALGPGDEPRHDTGEAMTRVITLSLFAAGARRSRQQSRRGGPRP